MELTPEQVENVEKLHARNLAATALKKLKSGKPLTTREHSALVSDGRATANFAGNWDDLAKALDVTARAIRDWRDDPRYKKHCPKKRADGRHDIDAWISFTQRFGLKRAESDEGDHEPTKAHWDKERSRIDYERAVFNLDVEKRKHVELEEICGAVGQMLAGFRTTINMLPGSAARWLIGLKDFHEIKSKLQSEVDGVLQSLGRCHYIEDLAPEIINRLLNKQTEKYRADVQKIVTAVFVEIGRKTLRDLMQEDFNEPRA